MHVFSMSSSAKKTWKPTTEKWKRSYTNRRAKILYHVATKFSDWFTFLCGREISLHEEAISALASGQYSLAVQRLGFHGNTPNTKKSRISKITIRNLHLQNNIRTINSMRCFSKKAYKYFRGIFMMYSPKKKRFLCWQRWVSFFIHVNALGDVEFTFRNV